ncbi:MAG: PIN domain-containing protein [Gammaproteobacteria bacterium]|nr:PIN domain-containing protein [Gammaproteobacteria bacterium]
MLDESAYIDTGILGAYYCPEPLSPIAENALRQVNAPVISVLSEVEFCSLIARKRRLRELSERQAREQSRCLRPMSAKAFTAESR